MWITLQLPYNYHTTTLQLPTWIFKNNYVNKNIYISTWVPTWINIIYVHDYKKKNLRTRFYVPYFRWLLTCIQNIYILKKILVIGFKPAGYLPFLLYIILFLTLCIIGIIKKSKKKGSPKAPNFLFIFTNRRPIQYNGQCRKYRK